MGQENPRFAKNNGEYKYKYQEQERQDKLNLNWDSFKWRNYDCALGRFMSVDPLAEKCPSISLYAYCANNPVMYVDLDGRKVKPSGTAELIMIQNTLPKDACNYVKIDKNGLIDQKLLNSYSGSSLNFSNLKTMVNSDRVVEVVLNDKFTWFKITLEGYFLTL